MAEAVALLAADSIHDWSATSTERAPPCTTISLGPECKILGRLESVTLNYSFGDSKTRAHPAELGNSMLVHPESDVPSPCGARNEAVHQTALRQQLRLSPIQDEVYISLVTDVQCWIRPL